MLIAWLDDGCEVQIVSELFLARSQKFYEDMECDIEDLEYEDKDIVWDCNYDDSVSFAVYMNNYPDVEAMSLKKYLEIAEFLEDDFMIDKVKRLIKIKKKIKKEKKEYNRIKKKYD